MRTIEVDEGHGSSSFSYYKLSSSMLRSTKTNTKTRTVGEAVTALDVREKELREDAFRLGQVNAHLPEERQLEVLENLSEHLSQLNRLTTLEVEDEVRRQFWKGTGAGMNRAQ